MSPTPPLRERLSQNWQVLAEIYALIKANRRWALLPFFLVLAVLSLFMTLAGGSAILPAIYALF